MAKAHSTTSTYAKVLKKAVFVNNSQHLTVALTEGKGGFNTKASLKEGKGKGAPKAQTGMRGSYVTEKDAEVAFDKIVKEAEKAGWVQSTTGSRNAFSTIPTPKKK